MQYQYSIYKIELELNIVLSRTNITTMNLLLTVSGCFHDLKINALLTKSFAY